MTREMVNALIVKSERVPEGYAWFYLEKKFLGQFKRDELPDGNFDAIVMAPETYTEFWARVAATFPDGLPQLH